MGEGNPYSPERDPSSSPESWFSEKTKIIPESSWERENVLQPAGIPPPTPWHRPGLRNALWSTRESSASRVSPAGQGSATRAQVKSLRQRGGSSTPHRTPHQRPERPGNALTQRSPNSRHYPELGPGLTCRKPTPVTPPRAVQRLF